MNDFRDAEAIAEAVQRPTMRFVATKTAEQLDLQALHRVRIGEHTAIAAKNACPEFFAPTRRAKLLCKALLFMGSD